MGQNSSSESKSAARSGSGERAAAPVTRASTYIQDRIRHAAPGEVITLPDGVYNEDVTIDKPVTIRGRDRDNVIIISQSQFGMEFILEEGNATVSNVTILGKGGEAVTITGKGILTLEYCYIRSASGNGIRTWKHSSPVVRHNLVHNCGNQALLLVSGHGHYTNNRFVDALGTAGVWVQGRSDATFTANLIRNNEGHGFYLGRETKVRVRGNEIYGNVGGNVAIHTDTAVLRANNYRPGDISDRPLYTDTVSFVSSGADVNDSDQPNQPPEDHEIDMYEDPDRATDQAPMFYIRASEKYKPKIQPAPSFGVTAWVVRQGYKPAKGETNICSTISDAINQARAGDHIDVYAGTYIEDIVYPFPLNIIGRSREKVIIYPKERNTGISFGLERGSGSLKNVTVIARVAGGAAVTVSGRCDFLLANVAITSNDGDGVRATTGSNIMIRECKISDCRQRGVHIVGAVGGYIERNVIDSCMGEGGIVMEKGCDQISIFYNVVRGCRGYGVRIAEDCDVTVQRNEIYHNARQNVFKQGRHGICCDNTYHTAALSTTINGSATDGILAPVGVPPIASMPHDNSSMGPSHSMMGIRHPPKETKDINSKRNSSNGDLSGHSPPESSHGMSMGMIGASFSAYAVAPVHAAPVSFAKPVPPTVAAPPPTKATPAVASTPAPSATTTTATSPPITTPTPAPTTTSAAPTVSRAPSTLPVVNGAPVSGLSAALAAASAASASSSTAATAPVSSSSSSSSSSVATSTTATTTTPAKVTSTLAPAPVVTPTPTPAAAVTPAKTVAPTPVVASPAVAPTLTVPVPTPAVAVAVTIPVPQRTMSSNSPTVGTPSMLGRTPGGRTFSAAEVARHASLTTDHPIDLPPNGGAVSFLMLWYDTPSGRKLLKLLVKSLKVKYPGVSAVEVDVPAETPKAASSAPKRRSGRTPAVASSVPDLERFLELQWPSPTIPALFFSLRLPAKFPTTAASLTASVNGVTLGKPAPLPHTGEDMKELVSAVEERVVAAEQCLRGVDVNQSAEMMMDVFAGFNAAPNTNGGGFDEYAI